MYNYTTNLLNNEKLAFFHYVTLIQNTKHTLLKG